MLQHVVSAPLPGALSGLSPGCAGPWQASAAERWGCRGHASCRRAAGRSPVTRSREGAKRSGVWRRLPRPPTTAEPNAGVHASACGLCNPSGSLNGISPEMRRTLSSVTTVASFSRKAPPTNQWPMPPQVRVAVATLTRSHSGAPALSAPPCGASPLQRPRISTGIHAGVPGTNNPGEPFQRLPARRMRTQARRVDSAARDAHASGSCGVPAPTVSAECLHPENISRDIS